MGWLGGAVGRKARADPGADSVSIRGKVSCKMTQTVALPEVKGGKCGQWGRGRSGARRECPAKGAVNDDATLAVPEVTTKNRT